MAGKPAIVISAYNRPASLSRLLTAIKNAVYDTDEIELVISIDKSDTGDVTAVAKHFEWQYGPKKIIEHAAHLGLKQHILSCGDLAHEYGSVILLEDDLLVSPHFYSYAQQAQDHYRHDRKIAGISLYNYQVAESCFYPFRAIDDGSDVYFMQVASSWGQLWTKEQWVAFTGWLAMHPELPGNSTIPEYIKHWGPHSWKKHFIHYLIATGTYFVFPRLSLTTNFEEPGTNASTKNTFHAALQLAAKDYKFTSPEKSQAVYDAWFELLPACLTTYNKKLAAYDYAVDLYGVKETGAIKNKYLLTSKKANKPLLSFGMDLFPLEANIALNQVGGEIGLYAVKDHEFSVVKLKLHNVLEAQKKEDELGISIIIPVDNADEAPLKATLASIAGQAFKHKECIIVSHGAIGSGSKKTIAAFGLAVKSITLDEAGIEGLVEAGFKNAGKGILTWVMPGNTFTEGSLEKAAAIFRSNLNVSWIRGIDGMPEDDKAHDNLNVRKYRLVAGEAYKLLEQDQLNFCMEQDFFSKHCFEKLPGPGFSLKKMFFSFISSYQLIIVVSKLGTKNKISQPQLSGNEKQALIAGYRHLKEKDKPVVLFTDMVLQKLLPGRGISQWLYTSLKNFPDVLRYDVAHNTFYFSKR